MYILVYTSNFAFVHECHNYISPTVEKYPEPPSPPRNVRVVNSTSTSVTLAWEEPLSTGGRSREELRYNLWYRIAGEFRVTLYGTVNTTVGKVGGDSLKILYITNC